MDTARLSAEVNNLNLLLTKIIDFSQINSTRVVSKRVDNINLPREIMCLIQAKNQVRKMSAKLKSPSLKTRFNKLTKIVKLEIEKFKLIKRESQLEYLTKLKSAKANFGTVSRKQREQTSRPEKFFF